MLATRSAQHRITANVRRTIRKTASVLLISAVLMPLALAQESSPPPAPPPPAACTTDVSPYRDFDFWLGHWDVFDVASGALAGENRIERHADGCLITEHWRGARGPTGFSMNFYDPAKRAWRQVWQSAGVFIDYSGGLDSQGAMQLEGTITYHRNGRSAPFRGRWTPQPEGRVLQEFWEFNAEQDAWTVWFRGEYRPREAADSPPEQAEDKAASD